MNRKILLLFLFLIPAFSFSQDKFTVSGVLKDAASGETILGAPIAVSEIPGTGVLTNDYGFYSLTLPKGNYTLVVRYPGYQVISLKVVLDKNQVLNLNLENALSELKEIEITATKENDNVTKSQMGMEKLDIQEVNKLPVLFGEKDILKSIQLMPGVKSAGEGNSGYFVRGGTADQNLILLDEALVYNASHLLGFFSTFNSDAIKDAVLYKGTMPAQYGGRISSVLDIKMNDGNAQQWKVGGGLGLISSRLNVEGPIKKNKGSILLTGRRTYADVFLKASNNEDLNSSQLYFYDLNLKANYQLNDKNRLFLSAYDGRDKLGIAETFGLDWGNTTATLRWNHILNEKWFSNTSFIYSNYSYNIGLSTSTLDLDILSRIRDFNLKQEWQFFASPKHSFKAGLNLVHHTITPGEIEANDSSGIDDSGDFQKKYALENAGYIAGESKLTQNINLSYGLRLSTFNLLGGDGEFYNYSSEGDITDTLFYNQNDIVKTYVVPEPRVSMSYVLNESTSVKAAYTRSSQFLHLISNSNASNPTDLWIPSSQNVKPQIADQVGIGLFKNIRNNQFEFSVETYYKDMQNQIDYRDGASTQANELVEGELLYGQGRAYGAEFLIKKKKGKLTGWIGYTLSRTEKQIDGINNNEWYVARQDRTHELTVVGVYDLSERVSMSASWIYYTGNAVTFPSGKYSIDGQNYLVYTERNGYRMPAYHRLDLSLTLYNKKKENFESNWNFSLYNAYGRENAYFISFRDNDDDPTRTSAYQTTLFRWVPSITYNFLFK
ncbi:MAG: TonB-dependent receptor [Flavobacteriales bacterium]|jgi:hypothetical protein